MIKIKQCLGRNSCPARYFLSVEDAARHFRSHRRILESISLQVPSGSSRDQVKLDDDKQHTRWLICRIQPRAY